VDILSQVAKDMQVILTLTGTLFINCHAAILGVTNPKRHLD